MKKDPTDYNQDTSRIDPRIVRKDWEKSEDSETDSDRKRHKDPLTTLRRNTEGDKLRQRQSRLMDQILVSTSDSHVDILTPSYEKVETLGDDYILRVENLFYKWD